MVSAGGSAVEQRGKPSVAILVLISMVAPAGINIIAPSMPAFVTVFDTDYATVQLTLSLFLFAIACAQIIIGPLSDYFGRRKVVLYGMGLSCVGSVICIAAPTIEIFIFGRLIQGAGACTGIVLARAIVRDLYEREKAASMIGYVTMAMTIAPLIVPYVGGVLQEEVAWWGSSAFMLLFALAVFVIAYFDLHETNPHLGRVTSAKSLARDYSELLRSSSFLRYAGVGAFASCIYFCFMGSAPLLSSDLFGLSPTDYGLLFIFVAAGYGAGNYLSGRFSQIVGTTTMIAGGCLLSVVSVAAMMALFAMLPPHPLFLFAPMFVASAANGITLPSAIAGAVSVRPEIAGAASGFTGFFQIGSGAIAATFTGFILDQWLSIWPVLIIMMLAAILSLVTALAIAVKTDDH
ncbi:MAG: multidrug effflux MFS transporter [Pseudomonadota bacterium]